MKINVKDMQKNSQSPLLQESMGEFSIDLNKNYKVVYRDNSETIVSGKYVQQVLLKRLSDRDIQFIPIGDMLIRKSQIVVIKPSNATKTTKQRKMEPRSTLDTDTPSAKAKSARELYYSLRNNALDKKYGKRKWSLFLNRKNTKKVSEDDLKKFDSWFSDKYPDKWLLISNKNEVV